MNAVLRIQWAPRIKMAPLARLYQLDALGLQDEDLLDRAGFGLYQRCRSILMVTDACQVDCPQCTRLIESSAGRWSRANPIRCPGCGFEASYGQWRDSWRKQELMGGNAVPVYRAFTEAYPRAASYGPKLVLVDQLIHAFHFSMRQSRTFRPVASQLIAGSPVDVLAFLDRLAQASYATGGLTGSSLEWRRQMENAARDLPFLAERLEQARRINAQACQNASEPTL